jgi:hypothetical protein
MWWIADFRGFPRRSPLAQSELIDCVDVLTLTSPVVMCSLSIRGYACGHQRCIASDSAVGVHFVTSKELSDHIRTDHAADDFPDHKPYRCGLPGCNKSWKVVFSHLTACEIIVLILPQSVNGLQYHLQVYVRLDPSIAIVTLKICCLTVQRRISYKLSPLLLRRSLPMLTFPRRKHLENRNDPRRSTLVLMQTVHRYTNNSAV